MGNGQHQNIFFRHSRLVAQTLLLLIINLQLSCAKHKNSSFKPKTVYQSKTLTITQIADNSFVHVSLKSTQDFGLVPCNGLVVRNANETIVFDTPTNDSSALELIKWVSEGLHCRINAVIPTHFHDDCLGGLPAFHQNRIPSYAYFKTLELAKANKLTPPTNSFTDSLVLKVGDGTITVKFLGEGHTKDNVVGFFPTDNILFGGCLIKSLDAGKGYLGDANIAAWPATVEKVKVRFPGATIVVPGHGDSGDRKLLDYTIKLFKKG